MVDGGSGGSGNPWNITADDGAGNQSTTTIDGKTKTPGSGVTFVGDDLVNVVTKPSPNGDGTNIEITLKGSDGKEYTLKTYNVKDQGEYITNNVVEAISKMNEQGIKFFHTNEDENFVPVAQDHNQVDSSASGGLSTAIGVKAESKGKQSLAIGNQAKANGEQSIAIGTQVEVNGNHSGGIGDPSIINGNNSYSVGNNNTVATDNTFVLGNDVTNTAANSVFLGDKAGQDTKGAGATGTVSNATVGDISYGGFAGETSVGMVAVGNASEVRRVSGVAAGEISATSTDAINGSQLYSALSNSGVYVTGNGDTTNATLVKLGDKANGLNFVDGNGTTADVKGNTVTFHVQPGYNAGIEAGNNVELEQRHLTDQNGNPLYIDSAGNTTTDATDASGVANKPQETTVIHAKQPDLRPIEQHVQQVENNAYAGVAQAMATAGLPQAYLPGKSMIAVAGGHYKGETGYALGLSSISDSGNWVFKATASGNSRNNFGGTVGAGYQW